MKYKYKTRPYAHQVRALRKMIAVRNGALLMDPRTGKTKVAIDYASVLAQAGKIGVVVVVCPARVMDVWVEQFHMHSPLNVSVTVWDARARQTGVLPRPNPAHDLTAVIVNYDAFATPGRRTRSGNRSRANGRFKTRALIWKWIAGHGSMLILDESHKIKSPSGKSSNMVVSMAPRFDYRLIMTGTPVTKAKRVADVYMQWKVINPGRLESLGLFTHQQVQEYTGIWTSRNGFPQWLRARDSNLSNLRMAIHQDAFSVRRSDCFDLPPRDDHVVSIPLSGRCAQVYDKLAREMVAEIIHQRETHTVEAGIQLTLALRLAQITGGVATTDEDRLIRIGNQKLDVLKELLKDVCVEDEQKVVVAARFKADLNAIVRVARQLDLPTFELRGGISREDGTTNIRNFQRADGAAVFVMQPASGSLGIDLSAASRMVWYSLTTSFVDFSQACDRIALSRDSTTFTYLLAKSTVDEVIYDALQSDGDVARLMVENPERILRKK